MLTLLLLFAVALWAGVQNALAGGAVGAGLLLLTPSSFFARLLPWLVLFATALFIWGSVFREPGETPTQLGPRTTVVLQFLIATYGGYFGGGIGFLMLAALTAAGLAVRAAGATKNILASVMNAAAVAIFLFTAIYSGLGIPWTRVAVISLGAMLGGYAGARLLQRVDEKIIRGFVILLGLCLTVGLFLRQGR